MNVEVINELEGPRYKKAAFEGNLKKPNVFENINAKIKSIRKILFKKAQFKKCSVSIKLEYDPLNKGETYLKIRFCVKRSKEEVYKFCRNITNYPLFISQLINIKEDSNKQSYWKVTLLRSKKIISWEMQITNEIPNQLICWEALKNSFLESEGTIQFVDIAHNKLTEVRLFFSCKPLSKTGIYNKGFMGQTYASLLKKDIHKLIKIMEHDDSPGQPHSLWI